MLIDSFHESKSSAETGSAFHILPAENLNVFFPDDFTWDKTTDTILFLVKKKCYHLLTYDYAHSLTQSMSQ